MNGVLFITHQTKRYCYLDSVQIALEGGCRQIQLRMKEASVEEVVKVGIQVKALCAQYGSKWYVDDHVEICQLLEADGVHLGKNDMTPAQARHLLGRRFTIGGTANTFDDICLLNAQGVDYIGLGPYRFTSTKTNLSPVLGLHGYQTIIQQCVQHGINLPVVAIGGITLGDVHGLIETGVSSIALSSAVLSSTDPVGEMKRLVNEMNIRHKKK